MENEVEAYMLSYSSDPGSKFRGSIPGSFLLDKSRNGANYPLCIPPLYGIRVFSPLHRWWQKQPRQSDCPRPTKIHFLIGPSVHKGDRKYDTRFIRGNTAENVVLRDVIICATFGEFSSVCLSFNSPVCLIVHWQE